MWLSVWSEMQMISIWSCWCHFNPILSFFIKILICLAFLVPAFPGCPGKETSEWNGCLYFWLVMQTSSYSSNFITTCLLFSIRKTELCALSMLCLLKSMKHRAICSLLYWRHSTWLGKLHLQEIRGKFILKIGRFVSLQKKISQLATTQMSLHMSTFHSWTRGHRFDQTWNSCELTGTDGQILLHILHSNIVCFQ